MNETFFSSIFRLKMIHLRIQARVRVCVSVCACLCLCLHVCACACMCVLVRACSRPGPKNRLHISEFSNKRVAYPSATVYGFDLFCERWEPSVFWICNCHSKSPFKASEHPAIQTNGRIPIADASRQATLSRSGKQEGRASPTFTLCLWLSVSYIGRVVRQLPILRES